MSVDDMVVVRTPFDRTWPTAAARLLGMHDQLLLL
jgi:hypothetical protein